VLKLADRVKDEGTLSSRSLQTPQELLLFYRLLAAHRDDAEGLRIFRDERLGPKSKIAKDEWVFRRKQIDILGKRNDWQGLFDTTYELLSNSRANSEAGAIVDARGADWLVWKEFLRAVLELQTEK
jgi:N-terminal acetyltransferase B complex non-catalytic subunit